MGSQLQLWGEEKSGDRLRWSVSRDRRLRDCTRKYYLFHYGSRGGGDSSAPRSVRDLFVLRSLRNRYMWVGGVVHEMIELALGAWRRNEEVPLLALIERGTRLMRAQYAESLQGVYWDRPLQAVGLVEHEYKENLDRETWRAHRDHMEKCLRNFFALPLTEKIRALPRWRWLAVESAGSFELDGATVIVRPDFAWRDEDDRVVIVDWKTGIPRPEESGLQLAVYGLFARRTWGLGDEYLRAMAVYLATGDVDEWPVDLGDLRAAQEQIVDSLRQMRELAGADPKAEPDPAAFAKTDDLDRCRSCGFKRICARE